MALVSPLEIHYIREGIEQDMRIDGRNKLEYRFFQLHTNVIAHANASARLQLQGTDVLVGVKVEICEPEVETPLYGRIECSVDCVAGATVDDNAANANMNTLLSAELERCLIESDCLSLDQLCIVPGEQCWGIYVDAIVLHASGNVLDAITMASKAALLCTTLPPVEVVANEDGSHDIVINDDPFASTPIDATQVPISITICKVGKSYVLDASLEEEEAADTSLSMNVDRSGKICGMELRGKGSLSRSLIEEMTRVAGPAAVMLHEKIDKIVEQQKQNPIQTS